MLVALDAAGVLYYEEEGEAAKESIGDGHEGEGEGAEVKKLPPVVPLVETPRLQMAIVVPGATGGHAAPWAAAEGDFVFVQDAPPDWGEYYVAELLWGGAGRPPGASAICFA